MSKSPITTRSKQAIPPQEVVFPDDIHVRCRAHVPSKVLVAQPGYKQTSDADGFIYEYASFGNLTVSNSERRCKISGSFRNWADVNGVVPFEQPFGCKEVERTYRALENRLGLTTGTIDEGSVCHLEYAADLIMPRHPALYVAAIQDPKYGTPYKFGYKTFINWTTKHELRVYDKVAELEESRKGVPSSFNGEHVLRIEDVRNDVPQYFERSVRAADLHDEAFRIELAYRWERRARSLSLRRTRVPVSHPKKMSRLRDYYALRGIEAEGGFDAAVLQVRIAKEQGAIKRSPRDEQMKWLDKLACDPEFTRSSDLAEELDHAIRRVMGS